MLVTIHNDKPICESLLILQYIDDVFTSSPSMLPSDLIPMTVPSPGAAYIDDKWFSPLHGIGRAKSEKEKAIAVEQMNTGLGLLEETFEKITQGKGFFGGERIEYIDITLRSCLGWLKMNKKFSGLTYLDETKMPDLFGWAKRFCSDDLVKYAMPETDKLVEFAMILVSKLSTLIK